MEHTECGICHGSPDLDAILDELMIIRADMAAAPVLMQRRLEQTHENCRDSAKNLLQYLALRCRDIRPLQLRLAALGLSSLGRAESHVLCTIDAVLDVLHHLTGRDRQPCTAEERRIDFAAGQQLLSAQTQVLLGTARPWRSVRIMVTMPGEAAHNYSLIHDLLRQGMDCMRINCAHDDAATWAMMIEHLRRAEQALGRSCKIMMDLAGPKLRTGPLEPGPEVLRVRPQRDAFGRLVAPARVWLTAEELPLPPPAPADACLPLPAVWLSGLKRGAEIKFTDARDSKRTFRIADVTKQGCWAEAEQTAYIVAGTVFWHKRLAAKSGARKAEVGSLPPAENAILLCQGDLLILTRDLRPGRPAVADSCGHVLTPAMIGCTLPEVFDDVRSGEPVWFDDGKIGGVVEQVDEHQALVRVTHVREQGARLRADKGINLPESALRLTALSDKDVEDLAFAARHADAVGLSFANSAGDVELLQQHLARLGSRQTAIVLKIETRRGFDSLPDMLLMAMRSPCCGVMIARGDLAVECGFERLAEVQEEMLCICEAAHVPVIWATQVLESMAKDGMPSRAEISDAAIGHRAECVMLNKGPHIVSAVRVLDDILRRMQAHQAKKQAMLRELRLAHALTAEPDAAAHEKLTVCSSNPVCSCLDSETLQSGSKD